MAETVSYHPIGYVENDLHEPAPPQVFEAAVSRIVVDPALVPGLEGIEPGQDLVVVFHLHRVQGYELRQHPRADPERPLRGVFALRSPRRPNPIGLTTVRVLAVERNVLTVRGLDAIDGTPVLDLKPPGPTST